MSRREEKNADNKTAPRKKKWILRAVILACIAVYAVIIFGSQQPMLAASEQKKAELTARVAELEQQKAFFERQQMYVDTDQYTESMARDKLKWIKDDEILFRDNDETGSSADDADISDGSDDDTEGNTDDDKAEPTP